MIRKRPTKRILSLTAENLKPINDLFLKQQGIKKVIGVGSNWSEAAAMSGDEEAVVINKVVTKGDMKKKKII